MASHHHPNSNIVPLWDQPPLDYERRPNLYAPFETDADASFRDAVYAFMEENLIAIAGGFVAGMMATVGLAYVISWFI